MRSNSQYGVPTVQSLQRALRLLKCFSSEKNSLTLSEISGMLGLHKTTTHRLINTMIEEGFIRKKENRYFLDWIFIELGAIVSESQEGQAIIHDRLKEIVHKTGETAHFAILHKNQVLYIDKVESNYSLRIQSYIGKLGQLHCTALGKVLLAHLDEEKMLPILYGLNLKKIAKNTITNHDLLRKEIMKIRQQGFAIDNEENESGLMCLAVPVFNNEGVNYGAISISGPISRIENQINEYLDIMREETKNLSKLPGYQTSFLSELVS